MLIGRKPWSSGYVLKVVGSNPGAVNWMEMTFLTLICCKILYCLFEKTENKRKGAGVGPFKKVFITQCDTIGRLSSFILMMILVDDQICQGIK